MTLHAETSGHGEEVVLLHGWGMNAAVWDGVRAALSARYRVHAVDLPGHGASPMAQAFSLGELSRLLATHFPAPVHVVGWSLGGMAGLRWALDAPAKVKSLTLVAATPRFLAAPDWRGVAPEVLAAFAEGLEKDFSATLARFLALQARGDEAAQEALRGLKKVLLARGAPKVETLRAGLAILRDTDMRAEASRLSVPLRVIAGERDTLTPPAAGEWLANRAGGRLAVIRGAAHAPFFSHPEAFLAVLREFLP
jgi:pimeloyl-[acyl-carrier protein] methyl ester esterase